MSDPVTRWLDRLESRIGVGETERKQRHDALLAFCTAHGLRPDELLARWQEFPALTVRRTGAGTAPELAVESFLIHNGVNVFGEIVCVAGRPEDLALQGRQFVPRPDGR